MAESLDRWWDSLGRPDPFVVVEAGAGDGRRAAQVLQGPPRCAPALRYVLVEADPARRSRQGGPLRLESPELVLGQYDPRGGGASEDEWDRPPAMAGGGPLVASIAWLPTGIPSGVVVGIAVVAALGYDLLEFDGSQWCEVRLAAARAGGLEEVAIPLAEGSPAPAAVTGLSPSVGDRVALWGRAQQWLGEAASTVEEGLLVLVDRFAPLTSPLGAGPAPVALDQLALPRRRPRVASPPGIFPLLAAEWDLGPG